jgi:muconolactone delta-isomerase
MQFLVEMCGTEASVLPPAQETALMRETFEQIASGRDKRIKACYPYVGERACALLIEATSPEELQETLMTLPSYRLVSIETHCVGTARSLADMLGKVQQRLGAMPAHSGRN